MPIFDIKPKHTVSKIVEEVKEPNVSTGIHKYNVLNPVTNPKLPFFDERKGIFYVPLKTIYRYYVEATVPSTEGYNHYYLLLGKTKYDTNCRLCHTDAYGRVQVKIKGEIRDFVIKESLERGNVQVTYIESTLDYDVYEIT